MFLLIPKFIEWILPEFMKFCIETQKAKFLNKMVLTSAYVSLLTVNFVFVFGPQSTTIGQPLL